MTSARVGSVVVLGGGVVGMSTAFELAGRVDELTLVDPSPGGGASWAAAGMLSPVAEIAPGEEPLLEQLRVAARMWPSFSERLGEASGVDVGYAASSSILVGASASDVRDIARSAALMRDAGATVEPLTSAEVEELEPLLAGRVQAGFLLPDDARVDNRLLVAALLEGLKASGVRFIEDRCTAVSVGGSGVHLDLEHQGALDAQSCVIATGAAAQVAGSSSLGMPVVRPVRGATLRLGARAGVAVPARTVRAVVDSVHCYLVPRADGSLVLGATSEEQGFARDAPAGGVFRLLEAARTVFPGVDELTFEDVSVGLRPATEDHLPFVGRLADPRVVAAVGHYRNGILLAPLAGRLAAEFTLGAP